MYKLGIDIGGTKIRGVVIDDRNKKVADFDIKTPKNKNFFLVALEREIIGISVCYKISGIGIGLPGIVDVKRGVLVKAPNLPFLDGWQAREFFKKYSRKVAVENDSRCFLLAELKLGNAQKYKNAIGLTIGTGIGGAMMIGEEIYRGANFGAGEFGHMIIDDKKSFEQLAAKKAFEKYGDRSKIIGIGIANIINILNPEAVILGGGGVATGGVKIELVKKEAKKYIMSPLAKNTIIIKGKLGKYAPAIGAALLIF
ncbi:MAG: ROK family protein [Candidatus Moranbacteria bacterium GW2011_GWF2_37_7]|nr:MAG: ROK family protein [Candidatus Moranbacteria bacterium GW2011_GWF2_37_7]